MQVAERFSDPSVHKNAAVHLAIIDRLDVFGESLVNPSWANRLISSTPYAPPAAGTMIAEPTLGMPIQATDSAKSAGRQRPIRYTRHRGLKKE
jgi:hypothetical protein